MTRCEAAYPEHASGLGWKKMSADRGIVPLIAHG
jgi:hypothetical protein